MNIIDYLDWRGDLSLKDDPFNEVDALCFASSSYAVIDEFVENGKGISLSEVGKLYFEKHTLKEMDKSKSLVAKPALVIKALGESERFGSAILHDLVSVFSEENVEQFCAFEVDVDEETTIVAFRGTDDSAIGWQEDFDMTYKVIPAQKQAEKYVNEHCLEDRKYLLLGHSKGGNLAAYAALHAHKAIRDKIKFIYSFDGPGLSRDYYDINVAYELDDRYVKYIPEFDFFGAVFEDNEKCVVIKSDAFAFMQHDALTWQVKRNHFIKCEKTLPESEIIRKGMEDFMTSVSAPQRELFFKEVFAAFKELELDNISDISKASLPAFIRAFKKVGEMDEQSKEAANKVINVFSDVLSYKVNDVANDAIAFAKDEMVKVSSLIKEGINKMGNK